MTARADGNLSATLSGELVHDLQLAKWFATVTTRVFDVIAQRRPNANIDCAATLSMLIEERDKTSQSATKNAVIDELMTLDVPGQETTASTVNWIRHLLSDNAIVELLPHVELDAFSDKILTFVDLPELIYSKQVINDTLYLNPPAWLYTRKAVGDDPISGYYVAPQIEIITVSYFGHHHPQFWETAAALRLDHFAPEVNQEHDKFAYFPFR